jgi:hypothetical protein
MTKKILHYSDYEINILQKFYSGNGAKYCSTLINRTAHSIHQKAKKLGLRITNECKSNLQSVVATEQHKKPKRNCLYSVNPDQFMTNFSPESAYILGLMWADGNINVCGRSRQIRIYMVSEDLNTLLHIFDKTGKWFRSYRQRNDWKNSCEIGTSNRTLVEFLLSKDYKSCPLKVLSTIPQDIKPYWFRGLIDGDGCFYVDTKKRLKVFNISGKYTQDWSYMTELLDELSIKYNVHKKISGKGHKHSEINITNYNGIIALGNYIYKNYEQDFIGLQRKYNKFIDIKNLFSSSLLA